MAEQYDLTTPITQPTRIYYRVASIFLSPESNLIIVQLRGSDNIVVTCEYSGSVAATLLSQISTMNFAVTSLYKRILQRLLSDGKLPAGSVTGTP